jgi:hypothetical protein
MALQLFKLENPPAVSEADNFGASARTRYAPDAETLKAEPPTGAGGEGRPVLNIPACGVLCDVYWWARRSS